LNVRRLRREVLNGLKKLRVSVVKNRSVGMRKVAIPIGCGTTTAIYIVVP